MLFISRSMDWVSVRTGSSYPFKKRVTFAHGSGYAFETKLQPFEQLELSVQKKNTIIIIVSLYKRLELPV